MNGPVFLHKAEDRRPRQRRVFLRDEEEIDRAADFSPFPHFRGYRERFPLSGDREADAVSVGNLASERDFTHVKDIARAYRLIAERGIPGEVYNVGSGTVWRTGDILDRLIAMAECPVPVRQDPARMRPSDTPVIRCDRTKLTRDTGWEPELGLDEILRDTLEYYRSVQR